MLEMRVSGMLVVDRKEEVSDDNDSFRPDPHLT